MAITVESEEVIQRVRELAELTGEPVAVAIDHAVEERLERLQTVKRREREGYTERVLAAARAIAAQIQPDSRTIDELVGYDEDGLPN